MDPEQTIRPLKSLDVGEARIWFGIDKIVFAPKDSDWHWTLHLGPRSRVADLHLTNQVTGKHRRLLSARYGDLDALLAETAPGVAQLMAGMLKPFPHRLISRSGRVAAYTGLVRSGEAAKAFLKVRGRRATFSPQKFKRGIEKLDDADDLYTLPDGEWFTLYEYRSGARWQEIGCGFTVWISQFRGHTWWIDKQRQRRAMDDLDSLVAGAMARYVSIEPE